MNRFDVIVVGAGVSGAALALALDQAGVRVAVLDHRALPGAGSEDRDGRAWAMAASSVSLLERTGIWPRVRQSQPILEIRVSDGHAPVFLHYDHADVGDEALGEMVYAHDLTVAASAALRASGVTVLAPSHIEGFACDASGARISLDDGTTLKADLLVGADGRNSALREEAGIATSGFSYRQSGIVCTINHEMDHRGIAHERFLPIGPFAILPLPGGFQSSLVWTESEDLVPSYLAMPISELNVHIAERVGGFLGEVSVTGPVFSYPLTLQLAHRYVDTRLALIGDAAHVIHPIAGQGLNLGLRDVGTLASVIIEAARLGLDVGMTPQLASYNARRQPDTLVMAGVTDALNRLFSNDNLILRTGRDIGLSVVNRMGGAKKLFMRHAMGRSGLDQASLMVRRESDRQT